MLQFRPQLQLPQRVVPHPLQQLAGGAERFAPRLVVPMPARRSDVEDPGIDQRAQLQGDGAERDVAERLMDLPCLSLLTPDQPEDFAPPRGRDDSQHGASQGLHRCAQCLDFSLN